MCHRVICHGCGKFTWEGCGLHIAQALTGLSLKQICTCDDDRGGEHAWTMLQSSIPGTVHPTTCHPLNTDKRDAMATISTSISTLSLSSSSASLENDPTVKYKLSKLSATSATEAALRMVQQTAALEELRKRKREKDQQVKEANQDTLRRLLQGLSQAAVQDDEIDVAQ
ncbi:hypothetical protein BGZ51_005974 [Haplosporangium sp. Z 767]|nr:hypothetical protein BGZ51_005974 [Haplosporangium sp. Z 767]